MIKLVWATDPHVSDIAPVSRTDNWTETILDKISQVLEICEDVGAKSSIWGGDIFNIKQPDRNSFRTVNRMLRMLKSTSCDNYSNVGNHDCKFGDYKFLPDQPLEALFAGGGFKRLYDNHEAVFTGFGVKVRVVGIPYHGKKYDLERIRNIKKGSEDYLVCNALLLATDSSGTMFDKEDVLKYSDIPDLASEVDVWMFGHWHKDQGIKTLSNGSQVVNVGSLSRGALSEDNIQRTPCVAILEFGSDKVKIVKRDLKVQSSDSIFDLEKRSEEERRDNQMDDFVDRIQATLQSTQQRASFESRIAAMDIPDHVKERGLHFIELARTAR